MTSHNRIAFLFPGQGAQYPGMGRDFLTQFAIARQTFEEANDTLNRDLISLVLEAPEEILKETKNSQVAIYVTSMAVLRVINELFPNIIPRYCAGLSLGEYTALTASGKASFAECLSIVNKRGQFMNDSCEDIESGMAVVLGLNGDHVEEVVKSVGLPHDLWAANFNCPGQVVISGTKKGIEAGAQAAKAKGAKRVLPLQVHGAFHTPLMQKAEDMLTPYLQQLHLLESTVELIMNVVGTSVHDLNSIRQNLIKQVTNPVRWETGIRWMDQQGVDLYLELGCGETLTGFNHRIGVKAPTLSISAIEDIRHLERKELV